jgi:transposase
MNRDCFWLTEDQFSRLAPLLPSDTRGKPRVDDRRVISGIVHVLKSGGRWIDAPDVYGPHKTLSSVGPPRAYGSISLIFWHQQEARQRKS